MSMCSFDEIFWIIRKTIHYIHIYIHIIYIYTYIHIERHGYMYVYTYTYILTFSSRVWEGSPVDEVKEESWWHGRCWARHVHDTEMAQRQTACVILYIIVCKSTRWEREAGLHTKMRVLLLEMCWGPCGVSSMWLCSKCVCICVYQVRMRVW